MRKSADFERYIGQRDSDGKSVSRSRILCFIFLHRFYILLPERDCSFLFSAICYRSENERKKKEQSRAGSTAAEEKEYDI